ncbi:MAG: ABC transporter permease [Sphingobacteriales bacterium]
MIKNYLKIAWRNLLKNKAHTFINVSGLSVGMAVAMLIGLWIWDEVSYDKYFQNHDHLVQVMQHQTFNGERGTQSSIPLPLGPKLRADYTGPTKEFKYVVNSTWTQGHILAYKDKKFNKDGNYMQAEAPDMLSLKMLKGTRGGLKDPSSILLSQTLAKVLFGDSDPMNQTVKLDNKDLVKVTGVFEDFPHNTSFNDMTFILPWDLYLKTNPWTKQNMAEWGNNSWQIFAQLNPNANIEQVSARIKDLKLNALTAVNDKLSLSFKPALFLHPMNKWHLYSEFKNGVIVGGNIEFVWMFGIIGVFVLLLACINFMNLSTARSEKRAKEVGIRKTLGSLRQQLITQFFSESLLVSVFAFIFSIILVQLALPWFNQVADKQMAILWASPAFWIIGVVFTVLTGIIAGSYPAFYLSSFQPVKVLKGTFKAGRLASLPRKILVVLQFTVSATLIIGTVVVFIQVQHTKDRAVGYDRAGMIQVYHQTPDIHNHFEAVKYDLIKSGAVISFAESGSPITEIWSDQSGFSWKGMPPGLQPDMGVVRVSTDFGKTIGWQIKEGRDFSKDFVSDSLALIVNESAVKFMGLKNPIGTEVKWGQNYRIIGVVKDMVMTSPYEPVMPTTFSELRGSGGITNIRLNPHMSTSEALSKIEPIYRRYDPGSPFNFEFTDVSYAKKFADEERTGKLAGFFTFLAIFISCMGLFGMASFMAEQRIKEIGVRKVLGASVANLWSLMSREFIILVLISLVIATPIAHHFMSGWLLRYKYHADLSWWIFGLTALGAMVITLLTVSYQSIKAATANPVKSLRSE